MAVARQLSGMADRGDFVLPLQLAALGVRGRAVRLGRVINAILSRHDYPAPVAALLSETLVLGSALAVAVGVLMLFVPARLAALEARLDRWYSTRQALPAGGESMRYPLDTLVEASPRAAGWLIAAASLLVAAAMTVLAARLAA